MGDGMRVLLCALKIQHFAVTALGRIEILTQRTGVTKVAEGIGEFPKIMRRPVLLYGGPPGRSRLHQIAPMEEDPCTVLVGLGHDGPGQLISALRSILSKLSLQVVLMIHPEPGPEGSTQLLHLIEIRPAFAFGRGEIVFTESETGLKVTGNRLFCDLLPGDVNAKGLEGAGAGVALCEVQ